MNRNTIVAAFLFAASFTCFAQPSTPATTAAPTLRQPLAKAQAFPLAHQYVADFLQGNGAPLWDKMNADLQKALGGDPTNYVASAKSIAQQLGKVRSTEREVLVPALDLQVLTELVMTDGFPSPLLASVAIDPDGKIAGLSVRPVPNPAPTEFLNYKLKNNYRFPLKGEWFIYQGGVSVYDNYHAASRDERFAYDIVKIENGSMYRDGPSALQSFYGFGQPVFVVAAGTVVSAQDMYDDNMPNHPSAGSPKQGNAVVVDHGNGEYSFYAHLHRGSIKVKAGQKLAAGDIIGEVGNSGNSPLPHLHFHLQNSATWFQGDGLPLAFHSLDVNGKSFSDTSPIRGDLVKAGE